MQVVSFSSLLEKYQDYDLNPAAEKLSVVQNRMLNTLSIYYFIVMDKKRVGALRVVNLEEQGRCRVSPIFVLPEFRCRGVAQRAFKELELLHPPKNGWVLQTIAEESGNCHLYIKLGYLRTGKPREIKANMNLVTYEKPSEFVQHVKSDDGQD